VVDKCVKRLGGDLNYDGDTRVLINRVSGVMGKCVEGNFLSNKVIELMMKYVNKHYH
jgi:hypothetical protein